MPITSSTNPAERTLITTSVVPKLLAPAPQCLSDDITPTDDRLEFTVPKPITVMPVSTANLEAQARKVLARRSDDNENYRHDMIEAGRGRLLK